MDHESRSPLKTRTLVAQGIGITEPTTRALAAPIHMSTTYLRDADNGYSGGRIYGACDNPSVQQAGELLAALEGGEDALMFSSGMAAAGAVFQALDRPTHVLASRVMYYGLRAWLEQEGAPFGRHSVTFVDTSDLDAVRAALRNGETGLVWIETPSNPIWSITDIAAAADIAHAAGALLCVDSTVPTPIFTRPLALGADIVMHSATKYLNGHSDVVAGALATARKDVLWERIRRVRARSGAILGPFDAWLLMRGMRTLHVRATAQAITAMKLANRLVGHPALEAVLYPGLKTHPGHDIALRQMVGGFGGMLSIRVKGGEAAAVATAAHVDLWKRATSMGGVESLIEHRASIEGAGTPCPPDLLRLSVGLEDADDLFIDLVQALGSSAAAFGRL